MSDEAPTPRELGELARVALINVGDLVTDARMLRDAERNPRAFALATLAAEEVGKHYLCVSWVGFEPSDRNLWRRFWKEFRGHELKLENWAGELIDLAGLDYETWQAMWHALPKGALSHHRAKLAALYVDFRDGAATLPSEIVSAGDTDKVLNAVQANVDSLESRWASTDIGQFLEDTAPMMRRFMVVAAKARETGDLAPLRDLMSTSFGMDAATFEELARRYQDR